MPRRLSTSSVALTSLVFTYLFFAEYLSPFRKVHIPYDLWGYHYPLTDYAFQALKHFSFPSWDPSIYCGQPFAANVQAALFYPPTWILFAISALRSHLAYGAMQVFVFAHIWLGFLLFFCWLRSRCLSDLACVLGGGIFAYSGYAMLQLQHLGLICGYVWLPLGLWGIDDMTKDRDWPGFLKLVAASASCFLAGYPPTWFVVAIYWTVYALFSGRLTRTLLVMCASLALIAIQLVPAIEASFLMVKENRYGSGFQDIAFYLSYLIPNFYNFGIDIPAGTNVGQEYLYLGAPALFGIAALLKFRQWRPLIPILASGFICLVFLANPFQAVAAVIGKIQVLSQVCRDWYFLAGITAAAAGLAAFGIERFLTSGAKKPFSNAWTIVCFVCAAVLAIYELNAWRPDAPAFRAGWWSALDALVTLVVFAICIFAFRNQSGRWRTAMAAVLVLSTAIDYKSFGTSKRFNAEIGPTLNYFKDGFVAMDPVAFQNLLAHREYRILLDETAPNPVKLRYHGLASPQGFDPFVSRRYLDLVKDLGARFKTVREFDFDIDNDSALQALAVRYVITGGDSQLLSRLKANPAFKPVGADSYFHVFEFQRFSEPFAWDGEASLLSRTPETRQFRVNSPHGSDFVLKEQFFPGWTAYLDGQVIPILLWHGAFQSVHIPAGDHSLDFRYQPRMLRFGAWISAGTTFLLALFASLASLRKTLFPSLS